MCDHSQPPKIVYRMALTATHVQHRADCKSLNNPIPRFRCESGQITMSEIPAKIGIRMVDDKRQMRIQNWFHFDLCVAVPGYEAPPISMGATEAVGMRPKMRPNNTNRSLRDGSPAIVIEHQPQEVNSRAYMIAKADVCALFVG